MNMPQDEYFGLPFGLDLDKYMLKRCWDIISHQIDEILDEFYREISYSRLTVLIEKIDVETLKSRQKEHWRKLFLGQSDSQYIYTMKKMHIKHKAINLPILYYVTSYLYILRKFYNCINEEVNDIVLAEDMFGAIDTIVAVDITRAMKSYHETFLID